MLWASFFWDKIQTLAWLNQSVLEHCVLEHCDSTPISITLVLSVFKNRFEIALNCTYFLFSLWAIIAPSSSESLFLHYYPFVFWDIITCNSCGSSPDVIREISPLQSSTKLDMTPLNYFSMLWRGAHRNHCHTPCHNLQTTINYPSLMSWLSSCASHTLWGKGSTNKPSSLRSTTALYQHSPDAIGHNSSS